MKIAFVLFEGMTALDFFGIYDPLTRLQSMGFMPENSWTTCGLAEVIHDSNGMEFRPAEVKPSLENFNLVVIPGGPGTRTLQNDQATIAWLNTISPHAKIAAVCSGALLLASAGFLQGKRAATHPSTRDQLKAYPEITVVEERVVADGAIFTSGGVTAGIDLGLYLCARFAGTEAAEKIRRQMDYPLPLFESLIPRTSKVERRTRETSIEIKLKIDGHGQSQIHTGLAFFDHMLVQIAVHGCFDLEISVQGDLEIDPHHTIEDTGLALGKAFSDALGDRSGIVRMANAWCPMDDSLATVTVDFSGRPYTVIQVNWATGQVGGIPVSMFEHFLESFAQNARCNLHVQVPYGKDGHHQAEAIFKALAHALDAATTLDPRRAGTIPSSKGTIE
ncbi:MAG TPA: imidazoleglycerol-phosphate dehydratase HisB [Anaerolineaceae bacterium]